jgi:hypothetical protein
VAATAQDSDMVLDSDRSSAGGFRCDRRESLGRQCKTTGCVALHNLLAGGCVTNYAVTIGGTAALEARSCDAAPWIDTDR